MGLDAISLAKYFLRILTIAENIVDFEKLFLANCHASPHVVHCPFINLTWVGVGQTAKGKGVA